MPNSDRPHGCIPSASTMSFKETIVTEKVSLISTNAVVAAGDVIKRDIDRKYDFWTSGDTPGGLALSGGAVNSGATIVACLDPNQRFESQTDNGTGTATAAGVEGLNINFVATPSTGINSLFELQQSSAAVTNTLPARIIKLYGDPSNAYGEFNRFICQFNFHVEKQDQVTAT